MATIRFPARFRAPVGVRAAAISLFTVLALLIGFALFMSPWLERRMGGVQVLDLMRWRSHDDVSRALEAYGSTGRDWYRFYLAMDALFPLVYAPLLATAMAFAVREFAWLRRVRGVAVALPFIGGMVFDWGENFLLWIQTSRFPDHEDGLSEVARNFTVLKFATLGVSIVLPFAALAVASGKAIFRRS